jgi:tetratricopeptide (TPR) repeat protein
MLVAISQLYLLQAIYDIVITREVVTAVIPIIMMVIFMILAAGVYLRQYWAYISVIILLIFLLAFNIIGMLIPAELTQIISVNVSPIMNNLINPAISLISTALHGFQFLTLALTLGITVLKAGPDFERIETRHTAKLQKGLQTAGSYHGAAQRAAQRGEWATAVLHWQRAAAKAPANRQFQRKLGIAYARLGFYQRSADVLQSALRITSDPEQQAQLNRLLTTVQKHINEENG